MPRVTIGLLMLATAILLSQMLAVGTSKPLAVGPQGHPAKNVVLGLQAVSTTYRDLADSLGIVVNRSNPVENLSFAELRKIFLGEQSHWSNGRRITVVMLEPGKQERQAVLTQIYRMDDKDFNRHFSQGMSTGEIHATPKTLATSTEVLKFVFNVPGAIGYVRVTEADDSVKVVHVDSHLPGDKDYSIRLHPKPGKQ
jgi:ABC-type phosphate transport system substrate-binding protein